jgi:Leucine-rich repeat (LRR) protein
MKKIFSAFCLFIVLNICNIPAAKAQADVNDSLALVDLYNSTDGPHWTRSTNWLTTAPLRKWYRVATGKHRVISIRLSSNNLSGNIPSSLGNLTNLSRLELGNNQLSGSIPTALGNLTNLDFLTLNNNQLSGSIPTALGNLTNLDYLALNNNQLSGNIPAELGNLIKLNTLYLNNNQLSGSIPAELGNLTYLGFLYLNNNQLSGSIPAELGNLTRLNTLHLNNNQLSGSIPAELGNLTNLSFLYLNNNQLSGSIPVELENLINIGYLFLSYNQLSGTIPLELGKLTKLHGLFLDYNQLSGSIPKELGNLESILILSLSDNKFRSKIPTTFSQLTNLEELNLRNNQLRDTVPAFLASLPLLKKLSIQFNHFTFDGLELLAQHNFNSFYYGFEKKIKVNQTSNTLSVYAGGTLSNNTYKWFNNGVLAATINGDSTFAPTASGNYSVEVTNSIATELTLKSDTVSFNAFASDQQNNISLLEAGNKNDFSVYPNPAKTSVTITLNTTGNYFLKLTDVAGNVLQTKSVTAFKGENTIQLNVSKYAAGTYFITLTNQQKQSQTLKLNKQ